MKTQTKAFTLVELLVVIGIIALLISILLPSLNNARRAASAVKCLSNLKTIGQAANLYSNEYKGAILPTSVQVDTGAHDYWPILLVAGRYLSVPSVDANNPIPVANSVFMCQSGRMSLIQSIGLIAPDSNITDATTTTPVSADGVRRMGSRLLLGPDARPLPAPKNNGANGACVIDTNYAVNGTAGSKNGAVVNVNTGTYVELNADKYLPAQSISLTRNSTNTHNTNYKLGSFKRAANTVFIMDGFGDNLFNTAAVAPGCIWRITGARHGERIPDSRTGDVLFKIGTTNVLFLDGHVEPVKRDRLPFAAGGGNQPNSGKTQMLCTRALKDSLQSTDLIWNLRQQ